MEPGRPTAAERQREEREAAIRRRKTSVRLGVAGVVLLFAGGIGVILFPAVVASLLLLMATGLALIGAAFVLLRTPMSKLLQMPDK